MEKKDRSKELLIPTSYYEKLAKASQELYADYLSDLTRKRQGYLLLCSVITILVAYAFIQPTGGSLIVDFIIPSNFEVSRIVAGALSLYFLILYLGGVLQDRNAYLLRVQPILIDLNGLSLEIAAKIYKIKHAKDRKLLKEKLQQMRSEIQQRPGNHFQIPLAERTASAVAKTVLEGLENIESRYGKDLKSLFEKYQRLLNSSNSWNSFFELTKVVNKIHSIHIKMTEEEKYFLMGFDSSLLELSEYFDESDESDQNSNERERMDFVIKSINRYKIQSFLKNLIEVLFPLGLALFAIYKSWS